MTKMPVILKEKTKEEEGREQEEEKNALPRAARAGLLKRQQVTELPAGTSPGTTTLTR